MSNKEELSKPKPYKVIYLEGAYLKKNTKRHRAGHMDGLETSNDLEALIIEQDSEGYDLFKITPIEGTVMMGMSMPTTTTGFLVTFKKKSIHLP